MGIGEFALTSQMSIRLVLRTPSRCRASTKLLTPWPGVICCNTPDVIYLICTPTLAVSGLSYFISSLSGFCLRVVLSLSCISYHVFMCIAFAYVFVSCIRAFSPLSVLHSGAPISSGGPFYLFSCVGVKHFRIGPRLSMRPWFTTVDRLSSFVPFGLRLILQRLTEGPKRPRVCCSPTLLQSGPKPT